MLDLHYAPDSDVGGKELNDFWEDVHEIVTMMMDLPDEHLGPELRTLERALSLSLHFQVKRRNPTRILQMLSTCSVANFEYAQNPEDGIDVKIDDEGYYVAGNGTDAFLHVDIWGRGMHAAILRRDEKAIQSLISVPESIFENAAEESDTFDLAWYRLLKSFFEPDAKPGPLLIEAMKASMLHNDRRPEFIDNIRYPQLQLFHQLHAGDEAGFMEALREAIDLHKEYWSAEDPSNPVGWVSLPIMAACAMAYDRHKMDYDFHTDYLHKWLVKGAFQ